MHRPIARSFGIGVAIMLPSFRQIAATFLCGFVVMFAGLRIASSLNDIHEALPVMAAHAAAMPPATADPELRRGQSAVPVMYEMRLVNSLGSLVPTPINFAPVAVDPAPAAAIDVPLPPVADVDLSPSATDAPVASVSNPAAAPAAAPPAALDIPLPDPVAVDLTPSVTDRGPAADAASDTAPAAMSAVEPANAEASPAAAKANPPVRTRASKAVQQRTAARTNRRAQSDSFSEPFGLGNPASGAFGNAR